LGRLEGGPDDELVAVDGASLLRRDRVPPVLELDLVGLTEDAVLALLVVHDEGITDGAAVGRVGETFLRRDPTSRSP